MRWLQLLSWWCCYSSMVAAVAAADAASAGRLPVCCLLCCLVHCKQGGGRVKVHLNFSSVHLWSQWYDVGCNDSSTATARWLCGFAEAFSLRCCGTGRAAGLLQHPHSVSAGSICRGSICLRHNLLHCGYDACSSRCLELCSGPFAVPDNSIRDVAAGAGFGLQCTLLRAHMPQWVMRLA
jgi:hypothetical protein